jgi:NAD(P)-dependent dehydrogenase (short-subunit alcohol dehydrogenase family)
VLLDINEVKMAAVAEALNPYGNPVHTFRCNVTSAEEVAEAFAAAISQVGHLDYVFNNAGYQGMFAKTDDYPEADFQKVIDINVTGVFYVLKAAPSSCGIAGVGRSSTWPGHAGVDGPPNMLAYAASKFAVIGMTQTALKIWLPTAFVSMRCPFTHWPRHDVDSTDRTAGGGGFPVF